MIRIFIKMYRNILNHIKMSDDENKNYSKKNEQEPAKKTNVKRKCKSVEINGKTKFQSENKTEQKSTNSQYINPKDNLDNLNDLKNNLNGENKYLTKFINALENYELGNNNIKLCYENEEKMNLYMKEILLEKNDAFKLDNHLFELQAKKIFSEVYELKEKILYPYFSIEYSKNNWANTINIYYYQIEIKSENNNPICFSFPEATDTFLINFEKKPIIIEKKGDNDFVMSVISKDFNHSIDFHFVKKKDCFMTSLINADISDELFQDEKNVKETKNKIDSLNEKQINNIKNNDIVNNNNKEENELKIQKEKSKDKNREDNNEKEILTLKKKLKIKLKLIKEKYSKENIIKELTKKKEEFEIINL